MTREEIELLQSSQIIGCIVDKMDAIENAKSIISVYTEEVKELKYVLAARFQSEGISNMKIDGIGTATEVTNLYPKYENKSALMDFFREAGMDEYIKEDFDSSRVKDYIKECIENGTDLPEGLSMSVKSDIRVYRDRNREG